MIKTNTTTNSSHESSTANTNFPNHPYDWAKFRSQQPIHTPVSANTNVSQNLPKNDNWASFGLHHPAPHPEVTHDKTNTKHKEMFAATAAADSLEQATNILDNQDNIWVSNYSPPGAPNSNSESHIASSARTIAFHCYHRYPPVRPPSTETRGPPRSNDCGSQVSSLSFDEALIRQCQFSSA